MESQRSKTPQDAVISDTSFLFHSMSPRDISLPRSNQEGAQGPQLHGWSWSVVYLSPGLLPSSWSSTNIHVTSR